MNELFAHANPGEIQHDLLINAGIRIHPAHAKLQSQSPIRQPRSECFGEMQFQFHALRFTDCSCLKESLLLEQ